MFLRERCAPCIEFDLPPHAPLPTCAGWRVSQVKAAALFSDERFAGARPDAIKRSGWTRMSATKKEICAQLLRSRSVVTRADGGAATARTGVQWMLTVGTTVLLARLNKLLVEAGQTPMHRQTLAALIGGKEYTKQTPDLCCCASCRNLGFIGYELLRQIVHDVVPSIASIPAARRKTMATSLLARIDEEERYRAGEFRSHIKEEDSTPQHCLNLMCAPFNNRDFKCECTHGRHDGRAVERPTTMAQRSPRALRNDDWFESCYICYSPDDDGGADNDSDEDDDEANATTKLGPLLCCNECPRVAHKKCIAKFNADLPDAKAAPWTCATCVREHDAVNHDTRCLKCEGHDYLMDDLRAMCELALHDAKVAESSADAAEWAIAMLESVNFDLLSYHAHLVRDINQNMFQKSMFMSVEQHHQWVMDLCDYWAKQDANKRKTATCEGMANIGVSCHGRMFTFANPPQSVRDDHPEVPWETYPKPAEEDGPALCREYRRAWSDSSKQDSTDTAATRRSESKQFFEDHPWIKKNVGSISDGASNYSSTSAAIYGLLDDYTTVQCVSVEGMGKDNIDRDNASEQGKLRAARAQMDLTFSLEYIRACNARRHKGALNTRVELDPGDRLTPAQKKRIKPIERIGDMKLRAKGDNGSLVLWELFSRRRSRLAGRAVGYGNGRVISQDVLTAKHGLELHKLPDAAAPISFPEAASLPHGANVQHNPAPVLSASQKKDAGAVAAATAEEKTKARAERKTAAAAKVAEAYANRVHRCEKCERAFIRPSALRSHVAANCGLEAKRLERRRRHDAGTIRSLVTLNDEDMADEAELAEERGLDLINAEFISASCGWTLGDSSQVPIEYRRLQWATPDTAPQIGTAVRIKASRFGEVAFDDFGSEWRTGYYYGRVTGRKGASVLTIKFSADNPGGDDGVWDNSLPHVEVGLPPTQPTAPACSLPAVVKNISTVGAARRQLVHVGCTIINVDGVDTPTREAAEAQLTVRVPSAERPVTVVLRRPPPVPKSWRGAARSIATRRPPHAWHEVVLQFMDELLNDPALTRRSNAVYERLRSRFGHSVAADGRPMLPPLKDVEARMLAVFKNKQKQARDAAQDGAAIALARAVEADHGADEDGEVMTDDEGEADTVVAGAAGAAADGGAAVVGAPAQSEEDMQYGALDGATVAVLRQRLRAADQADLATVAQAALPRGTPATGPAKSAAVKDLLRRRLARVLADDG